MSFWLDTGMWYVYKISNVINEKLYIGITTDTERRWQQHLYCAHSNSSKQQYNQPLYVDMRHYGVDKFSMEIIEKGTSRYDMFKREKFWIHTLSTKRPYGYNSTYGYEISINAHRDPQLIGNYAVYVYTNSLTGEIFSIKVGTSDEWIRYIKEAQSGRPVTLHIVNVIRSIWQQGGKVVIRKVHSNLTCDAASRLERELLLKYGRKQRGSILV